MASHTSQTRTRNDWIFPQPEMTGRPPQTAWLFQQLSSGSLDYGWFLDGNVFDLRLGGKFGCRETYHTVLEVFDQVGSASATSMSVRFVAGIASDESGGLLRGCVDDFREALPDVTSTFRITLQLACPSFYS